MTRNFRRPGTLLLLSKIGICCVRRIRCIELATAQKDGGAWLNALPVASLETLLDSETFRLAIAHRLGADVCIPHSCRCGGKMDSLGLHGLSCKYSAGRFPRYSALNDVIKRALQKTGLLSVLGSWVRYRIWVTPWWYKSSFLVVVGVWFGIARVLILLLRYTWIGQQWKLV